MTHLGLTTEDYKGLEAMCCLQACFSKMCSSNIQNDMELHLYIMRKDILTTQRKEEY